MDDKFIRARELFETALDCIHCGDLIGAAGQLEASLVLSPMRESTLINLCGVYVGLKDAESARRVLDAYLDVYAMTVEMRSNEGLILLMEGRIEAAIEAIGAVLSTHPNDPGALNNQGLCLEAQGYTERAIGFYQRSLAQNPTYVKSMINLGNSLQKCNRFDEALTWFGAACRLESANALAQVGAAGALASLGRYGEALQCLEIAVSRDADRYIGSLVLAKLEVAQWTEIDANIARVKALVNANGDVISAFGSLTIFDSPEIHQRVALHLSKGFPHADDADSTPKNFLSPHSERRIRLGYFSMDFREHPVAYLIADLIRLHDRSRFEVHGFSFGFFSEDAITEKLSGYFDYFHNVSHLSDQAVSELCRSVSIDIAIDLAGHTRGARPSLFSMRVAPTQVSFLGYPGTSGINEMDYVVADEVVIPEVNRQFFVEKILYLPHCYQINSRREARLSKFDRAALGVQPTDVLLCCFNSTRKILPEVFYSWMRVLQATDNTFLWLLKASDEASENLIRVALNFGIDGRRVLFAPRVDHSQHLSRYRSVDLFLDTFPYGAHTTASDALWMGVPVVTRTGRSFASRVASSMLRDLGLEDLCVDTPDDYERLVIRLVRNPTLLGEYRSALESAKSGCALFDPSTYASHLEAGFEHIYRRRREGLRNEHCWVRRM